MYASRLLSASEKNYNTFEREALAVIFALKKFRNFLLSKPFRLFTEHQSLRNTFNQKDTHGRISRWLSFLADYEFEIVYRAGRKNKNADFCSRPCDSKIPNPFEFSEEDSMVAVLQIEEPLQDVMSYLTGLGHPKPTGKFHKAVRAKSKNFMVSHGQLFRRTKKGLRYVPNVTERSNILLEFHDEIGHWDFSATYKMISD